MFAVPTCFLRALKLSRFFNQYGPTTVWACFGNRREIYHIATIRVTGTAKKTLPIPVCFFDEMAFFTAWAGYLCVGFFFFVRYVIAIGVSRAPNK
jgi:hypothetical protein